MQVFKIILFRSNAGVAIHCNKIRCSLQRCNDLRDLSLVNQIQKMVQIISHSIRLSFLNKNCSSLVKKFMHKSSFGSKNSNRNYSRNQCGFPETVRKSGFERVQNVQSDFRTRDFLSLMTNVRSVFCDRNSTNYCCGKVGLDLEHRRQIHNWTRSVSDGRASSGKLRPSTPSIFDTMNQPLTVCVEGNIGSGKTTFLEYFKKYDEVCVFDEPISKWRDCQGYNLLDLMYKDPKKWSMCFQSYVQLTMLDLHTKPIEQPIKMMERSIYSAQYCFVKNLHTAGLLEEVQYSVLNEWFQFSTKNIPIKLDLIVYLRTDPEVAFARTNKRGRSEENSISLEYIQSVHNLHEDWLVDKKHLLPCPVLTLDANTALEDMAQNYDECRKNMFQKVAVAN